MTSAYTFVAPERQNELTRRIQQKLADAGERQKEDRAIMILPPLTPPAPDAPPILTASQPATSIIQ